MDNKQKGFTLYEATLAIALSGVLAASGLPRWVELQADADHVALKQLRAELKMAQHIHQLRQNSQSFDYQQHIDTEGFVIRQPAAHTTVFSAPQRSYCFALIQKPPLPDILTDISRQHPLCQYQLETNDS